MAPGLARTWLFLLLSLAAGPGGAAASEADGLFAAGARPPPEGWAAACAAEPLRTTGKVYHVCDCQPGADARCVPGDDETGKGSSARPYRSWAKVNALWTSMPAGSTIALCRGGRWDMAAVQGWGWANRSCGVTPRTTCILRDYAPTTFTPAVDARPVLAASGPSSGPMLGGGPGLVHGYRFLNLAFVHASAGMTREVYGLQAGDNSSDVEVCNSVFDGWYIGAYLQLGACTGTGGHRRHFRGNRFLNNCGDGALLDSHDSDWDGNYFDNNGHDACANHAGILNPSAGTTHSWYLSSRCDAQNVRFVNNEVHRSSFYQGHCTQASVVTGGQSTGLVIENNSFDGAGTGGTCGAFFGGNTYTDGSYHGPRNVVVRGNHIKQYSGGAIGFAAAADAVVENNVIELATLRNLGTFSSVIGLPQALGQSPGSDATAGGTVRNNTIYVAGTATDAGGSEAAAISVGEPATLGRPGVAGFNVTGNVIEVAPGAVLGACFRVPGAGALAYMDHNLCHGAQGWVLEGGTRRALPAWRAATGHDRSSSTASPQLAAPPADLRPAPGSPLLGAGSLATCRVGGTAGQPCASPATIAGPRWDPTAAPGARTRTPAPSLGAF